MRFNYKMSRKQVYERSVQIAAYNAAVQRYEHKKDALIVYMLLNGTQTRENTHEMYKRRSKEGAFQLLYSTHLLDDDTKFQQWLRVPPQLFASILKAIGPDITSVGTNFLKNPISPTQKLCLTLR